MIHKAFGHSKRGLKRDVNLKLTKEGAITKEWGGGGGLCPSPVKMRGGLPYHLLFEGGATFEEKGGNVRGGLCLFPGPDMGSNAFAFKCILNTFRKHLHLRFSNEKFLHLKKDSDTF